jgi:hypothetical protein
MKLLELKNKDLVEYSYTVGKKIEIKTDVVSRVISDDLVIIGNQFSFDFPNFEILKVWRESNPTRYDLIYKKEKKI